MQNPVIRLQRGGRSSSLEHQVAAGFFIRTAAILTLQTRARKPHYRLFPHVLNIYRNHLKLPPPSSCLMLWWKLVWNVFRHACVSQPSASVCCSQSSCRPLRSLPHRVLYRGSGSFSSDFRLYIIFIPFGVEGFVASALSHASRDRKRKMLVHSWEMMGSWETKVKWNVIVGGMWTIYLCAMQTVNKKKTNCFCAKRAKQTSEKRIQNPDQSGPVPRPFLNLWELPGSSE